MKIATVNASHVPGIGFQCEIHTDDGRSITFRHLGKQGIRWVAKVGYLVYEEFMLLYQRARQEIWLLRRQTK